MNEDLILLRHAIEEPVPQMLLAEVASPTHAHSVAQQIEKWKVPSRSLLTVDFDANHDDAATLWQSCHDVIASWDKDDTDKNDTDKDDIGLLVLSDRSTQHVRIAHGTTQTPTNIGFWRTMNQLREKWNALPTQTVFLVTRDQYFFLTTEADHFKRWIPLKLHLPGPAEAAPEHRIAPSARAADESLSAFLVQDDLEDKKAAQQNWDAYQERLRQALRRGESAQVLARRYYLPLMAAAITLRKLIEAANYNERIESVELEPAEQLRWLHLRSHLEEVQGEGTQAIATSQQRLKLAEGLDKKARKERGSQRQELPYNTLNALVDLFVLLYQQKSFDEAEHWIFHALNIAPDSAVLLNNYASFLHRARQDYEKAQEFYLRAVEAKQEHPRVFHNYALFLQNIRRDYDKADEFFRRSIKSDSENAHFLNNYANFLRKIRQDYDQANDFYHRAVEAEPEDTNLLNDYALFLQFIRQDYKKAEELYRRAVKINPQDANGLCNYANFLCYIECEYDKAEQLYLRAIEIEPENAHILGSYASLLCLVLHDFERAGLYFRRAMEADPGDPQRVINCAAFSLIQGQSIEGKNLLKKAAAMPKLSDAQQIGIAFHRVIHYPEEKSSALKELKNLLQDGKRAEDWTFDLNIERAQTEGHPHLTLLKSLAEVIAGHETLESLDTFPDWQKS